MGKLDLQGVSRDDEAGHISRHRNVMRRLLVGTLTGACIAAVLLMQSREARWILPYWPSDPFPSSVTPDVAFNWDTAATSPELNYSTCYKGEFQCARLELPMDYWNGTTNATVSLAVIRKPAVVDVTDSRYGGAILTNPGGPGGRGVGFLVAAGHLLKAVLDSDDGKYYDIISFDPRGVGDSRPSIQCFENLNFEQSWAMRRHEEGFFESSDAALGRLWSMSMANSRSCTLAKDGPDIRSFVSTVSVARDLLEIMERHGQWREKEAKRILKYRRPSSYSSVQNKSAADILESVRYQRGAEMIQYWGFSYGTYLGTTFAAMYPDRVKRLAVDGVVNADDYVQTLWSDNLLDAEKTMDLFYEHCARAGFPACALANKTGESTVAGIKERTDSIIASLHHNPLPVIGPNPEVITYNDVRALIVEALYAPVQKYTIMANLLADIERGNGTAFAATLADEHSFQCGGPAYRSHNRHGGIAADSMVAISCTDGNDQTWMNRTMFEKYVKELVAISPSMGSAWSTIRMHCIHWGVRPHHRFVGPWKAKTSHPVLMIGNTADPVTPVRHAHHMAKGFEGAVVLTQDSGGHCSISAFSVCTTNHIRKYFQTGELPPPNTTCPADEIPFGPSRGVLDTASAEILEGRERSAGFSRGFAAAGGGLMRNNVARNLDFSR
nr:putative hydrolase [Quercus suber]